MLNSFLITDWIANYGIAIEHNCNLVKNSVTKGEIVFYNYTQKGNRYKLVNNPIVNIKSLNNQTFDQCIFESYSKRTDLGNKS